MWWFFGYLGLAIILTGSLIPGDEGPPPIPHFDKVIHFTGYLIATFYFQQLTKNKKQYLIFILILAFSGIIELLQGLFPYRQSSLLDLLANALGGAMGTYLSLKIFDELLSKLDHTFSNLLNR
ncbi:MAG: VanZ family protein [Bacteriovoracaceae bacterium]|jgi:VanZ family protein